MAACKHTGRLDAAHRTFFRLSRSPRARARHGRRYPLRVHSRAARKRDRAAALRDDVFLLDGAFAGAFGIGGSRIFRLECFVRGLRSHLHGHALALLHDTAHRKKRKRKPHDDASRICNPHRMRCDLLSFSKFSSEALFRRTRIYPLAVIIEKD